MEDGLSTLRGGDRTISMSKNAGRDNADSWGCDILHRFPRGRKEYVRITKDAPVTTFVPSFGIPKTLGILPLVLLSIGHPEFDLRSSLPGNGSPPGLNPSKITIGLIRLQKATPIDGDVEMRSEGVA